MNISELKIKFGGKSTGAKMDRLQEATRLWFVCYVQTFPAEVEFSSFHLKNLLNQQLPKETKVSSELLYLHSYYVCILCMPSFFRCCLCALSALNISGFTPNSMAPPYRQSSFLFSACYVSSIDVTSPDTALGFLFRRYRPSK